MARGTNTFSLGAGFNITGQEPIDSRIVVSALSDLTNEVTWNGVGLYNGLVVAVTESSTLYVLNNRDDVTNPESWTAVGGTVDLTPYATTSYVNSELANKVDVTTQINGNALSGNVTLDGSDIALTGYSKAAAEAAVSASDSVNVAIGKLEKGIEVAKSSGVASFGGQTGAITVDTANSTNGAVKFAMSGKNLTGTVNGLKSAAYTESSAYATAAQGTKADSALQKSSITSGSANGTIAVSGTDVAVKGLGSAAYTDSTAYDTKGSATTAETNAKEYADSLMTWEEFE